MTSGPPSGRRAVFLDRDGTINVEVDYLSHACAFELLPGVPEALRSLSAAGFALVVVTNQSGIARGLLSEADLAAIHERMLSELAAGGVRLDAVLYCPHHPSVGTPPYRRDCACRKPRPGLILRAARELELELGTSWTVGDSQRDLAAGAAAGTRTLLVRTGKGRQQEAQLAHRGPVGARVVDDLAEAARWILASPPPAAPPDAAR